MRKRERERRTSPSYNKLLPRLEPYLTALGHTRANPFPSTVLRLVSRVDSSPNLAPSTFPVRRTLNVLGWAAVALFFEQHVYSVATVSGR